MGQGGTLSRWGTAWTRLVAGVSPSAQCVLPSSRRSSCPAQPAHPHPLHPPRPQKVSGHDAELDAGPQREALLCTVSSYGHTAGPHPLGFLQTLTLAQSHTGEGVTRCRLQPASGVQAPGPTQQHTGGMNPQTTVPSAPGQAPRSSPVSP